MKALAYLLLMTSCFNNAVALPSVVAHRSFLNQKANIATTTLYTPTVAGEYRISVYLESNNVNPAVNAKVVGSDDTNTAWSADANLSNNSAAQVTFVAHIPAGKPVQFGAVDFNSATYSVFIVIERIN